MDPAQANPYAAGEFASSPGRRKESRKLGALPDDVAGDEAWGGVNGWMSLRMIPL